MITGNHFYSLYLLDQPDIERAEKRRENCKLCPLFRVSNVSPLLALILALLCQAASRWVQTQSFHLPMASALNSIQITELIRMCRSCLRQTQEHLCTGRLQTLSKVRPLGSISALVALNHVHGRSDRRTQSIKWKLHCCPSSDIWPRGAACQGNHTGTVQNAERFESFKRKSKPRRTPPNITHTHTHV